ncbi:SDR family oxidoreductase [Bythopirellula goksoeyrii]|uniref:UDP-glucose 4-epimerase n=1 Tax=Bythopirellula goksoeyrii TaxID=1400387 RepID=A0A5B9QEU3_9BACT|nr:SDR family oxidoreductase [Bythopirellula goksoeyrii]QEG36022.1 UDP-glucose 4-epimerase [Bythopirellula goksoeyrii]
MARFLVTGGAGFIGSHLASALVDQGEQVVVLDNLSTGRRENLDHLEGKITFIHGDLLDHDSLEEALRGVEVVYHQAALASVPRSVAAPMDTHAACVTGTLQLLDLSRAAGVRRVVYAGSSSAYGDQPFQSKREVDLPRPLSPYAAAKLAGEYYLQAFTATYGLETVTIRYFNVFGPRQDPNSEYSAVIPKFVTAMLRGERPTIFGDGIQSRDFTFIDNVVSGNLAAAKAPGAVGRVLNVACGSQIDLLQLVGSINRVLGTKIEPIFADRRPGDVKESLADISLAREILDYQPVINFDEGLRRSIDYYRSLTG